MSVWVGGCVGAWLGLWLGAWVCAHVWVCGCIVVVLLGSQDTSACKDKAGQMAIKLRNHVGCTSEWIVGNVPYHYHSNQSFPPSKASIKYKGAALKSRAPI